MSAIMDHKRVSNQRLHLGVQLKTTIRYTIKDYNRVCNQFLHSCIQSRNMIHVVFFVAGSLILQDVLFVHPLDPRLSTTVLPGGNVVTSYRDSLTSSTESPSDVYVDVVPDDAIHYKLFQMAFHQNGFLRRVRSYSNAGSQITILRRQKRSSCLLSVVLPGGKTAPVNICSSRQRKSSNIVYSDSINGVKRTRRISDITTFNAIRGNNVRPLPLTYGVHFIDVLVREFRCGESLPLFKPVSFQLRPVTQGNAGHFPREQSVTLHTRTLSGREGTFLRLPNVTQKTDPEIFFGKCQYVRNIRANICLDSHLHVYTILCKRLQNLSADESFNKSIEYDSLCQITIPSLLSYCDNVYINNNHSLDCLAVFTDTFNFFDDDEFFIQPVEDSLNGNEDVRISPSIISLRNLTLSESPEISIRDERPVFKIVDITVIPRDPAPSEIYQVRLDYECATNTTIIQMNVTGSDQYTNHMTCTGLTACKCCIVHAAGAYNSVVDHVHISVSDVATSL